MHFEIKDGQRIDPNISISTRYNEHAKRTTRFVPKWFQPMISYNTTTPAAQNLHPNI